MWSLYVGLVWFARHVLQLMLPMHVCRLRKAISGKECMLPCRNCVAFRALQCTASNFVCVSGAYGSRKSVNGYFLNWAGEGRVSFVTSATKVHRYTESIQGHLNGTFRVVAL